MVYAQRLAGLKSREKDISNSVWKHGKKNKKTKQNKTKSWFRDRQTCMSKSLSQGRINPFFLVGSSTDCTRPTHIRKIKCLYIMDPFKC